jgi:hypothetical protein
MISAFPSQIVSAKGLLWAVRELVDVHHPMKKIIENPKLGRPSFLKPKHNPRILNPKTNGLK